MPLIIILDPRFREDDKLKENVAWRSDFRVPFVYMYSVPFYIELCNKVDNSISGGK